MTAERDAVAHRLGARDPAGIFAEGDVAHSVNAVSNRVPMTDDEFEQLRVAALVIGVAGGVKGDLGFGFSLVGRFCDINGDALHGDEAPAAAQAAFLRTEAYGFDAAADFFAVAFVPIDFIFRRGKNRAA